MAIIMIIAITVGTYGTYHHDAVILLVSRSQEDGESLCCECQYRVQGMKMFEMFRNKSVCTGIFQYVPRVGVSQLIYRFLHPPRA